MGGLGKKGDSMYTYVGKKRLSGPKAEVEDILEELVDVMEEKYGNVKKKEEKASLTGKQKVTLILFGLTFAFQLVTLPVEFNASHRALKILESDGMMYDDELRGARKVLKAAALTYITAAVSTLLQLLRLVLLFGRRSDD